MDTFAIVAGIAAIFWALTILAVVDVLLKDFGSTKTKAIWGFTALLPFVGWLIYLLFGFRKGVKKNDTDPK
ncbi:hypothetical protein HRM2_03960 [Desulforapulum autotrophicum HRM2]|jgi:hypothetical protein|uniref:Cardiolipin synthase N-terminal domain-containing protein n=1 Tax=Desulforapulum autotrophicum (strain ATCC 43914 / DSM 3382 / VKM B-1955 / HRM2) TaxID=177437 RepID=C0QGN9_DESAH|nr:PLDc N-terminal domain-containing protein [Desulforapulum autotrophicum]ACN13514.1 hypothetical protein HRM2_03960 [Desulforapulum autotrophicum HRM2]